MSKFDKNQKYVCVSGYGYTGSGACVDILKEFEGFGAFQGEFRIAKDPYGLIDLEESLVHNWEFIRHDVAIRDFLNYCEVLSRETGLFRKSGKGFANKLNVDFMFESRSYIDRLTEMKYMGDTFIHRLNNSACQNFIMNMKVKFSKFGKNNVRPMYFARPDEDVFIKETNKYIDSLFSNYMDSEHIRTLIIDQAIPTTNISKASRYFNNAKIIIIDRDPRDIYANMVKRNHLLGSDLLNKDSADKYINWHNQLRRLPKKDSINMDKYLLRLSFEDLVLNRNDAVNKIIKFLGGDIKHSNKGMYFSPEYSEKNIGLWKNYPEQSVMDEIGKKLKSHCFGN